MSGRYINRHTGEIAEYVDEEGGVVSLALTTGPDKGWLIDLTCKDFRDHWTKVEEL